MSGDHTHLEVAVGAGASLVLATQSSTKAYRARATPRGEAPAVSRLETTVDVAAHALAVLLPDPFVAFAGARVEQSVALTLAAGGSCIVWDAITAGRIARGESWSFEHLVSRITIDGPDGRLLTENVRLRPDESRAFAARGLQAFGFLALLGPRVAPIAARLLERAARDPAASESEVFVAHPFARGGLEGAILRVASAQASGLGPRLRAWLAELPELLGDDVLGRRAFLG